MVVAKLHWFIWCNETDTLNHKLSPIPIPTLVLPNNTPAAFLTQTVALDDATVKFEIWDTAGQERYRSLAPMYYRGAAAAIVVYDITNPDSFAGAKSWVKELQRRGDQNVVIAMVSTDPSFWSQWDIDFAIILILYTL